eukprot:Skav226432  [mRNA]  locus=scaffold696:132362:135195:+ [translate_table: standard]
MSNGALVGFTSTIVQLVMVFIISVSIKEFKQAMKDPALHAVFDALEISAGDAWALFTQLDRDGDAEVNVDEFLEGCMLLKGSGAPG